MRALMLNKDPLQGSTYCFQSESCQIERDCMQVEIAIFVDGSYRTSVNLITNVIVF